MLTTTGNREIEEVAQRVEALLDTIKNNELNRASDYAKLGLLLYKIRSEKLWIAFDHKNFGSYVDSVKQKLHVGRTQIYMYLSVVEKLLPSISKEDLTTMGVSKAIELKKVVSQTGAQPTQELIDFALNPNTTRAVLRGEVYKHLNIQTPLETGIYFELGCYVSQEECDEIEDALYAAERIDPVVPLDWPENSRKKEILLRLCREFLAEYASLAADRKRSFPQGGVTPREPANAPV